MKSFDKVKIFLTLLIPSYRLDKQSSTVYKQIPSHPIHVIFLSFIYKLIHTSKNIHNKIILKFVCVN